MKHALIIDDNRFNIDVLVMLLQQQGMTATTMVSPHNLTQILNDLNAVDIVFLDLEMPNHDGFVLLPQLRTHEKLAQTPIVAYTVHTSEIDVARQAGFDGFLGKPLNARLFPTVLKRILDGEKVWEI